MFNFAHEGHEHAETAVQGITTGNTLNYGALLILTLGVIVLFVGILLAVDTNKKSQKTKTSK